MMQPSRPNPYVGPRAFQTGEALYGRDGDILNLYYLLLAERVVLLFSPSGAGKSSLIHAGLIPRLREKFGFIPVIRVNQEPPERLQDIDGFNRYVFSTLLSMEEIEPEENRLPFEQLATLSLSGYLNQRIQPTNQDDELDKPVFEALIFEQFEEILTVAPNDYETKKTFFEQLGEALRENRRWALFSARQDYAAAFEPYLRAIPTRFSNRYRLDLLDADMALQAIQKPAQEMGVVFFNSAAQKLVDDLRRVQTQRPDGTTQAELGRYVEAVQLQVVCYRLWNNLSLDETTITEKHIASIGSVDESLSVYYTDQVNKVKEKFNVPERAIREWFNNQLITKQGIRSQVMLELEKSGGLDNRVIRFMESAHLVRAEKRAGSTWFELSHDRLIDPIRTDNEEWLTTNLSLLQQQANLWNQQDRPNSLFLLGRELAQARQWAVDREAELLQYEKDFLFACNEEENRTLRLKRRNQIISVLGVVAMILAVIAFLAYHQADIQRQEAQRQERVARAGQLAAQAHSALDQFFPQRSLLLALEALKVTSIAGESRQASAEESLRAALDQPHGIPFGNHNGPVTVVAYSNDGRWLASGSQDKTIEIWDLHASGPAAKPITLNANGTEIWVMGLSPDSHWLAAGGDQKDALLWNLTDLNAPPFILSGHAANIKSLAFSPDGRWLATGSVDETIRLWDLEIPTPVLAQNSRVLSGHHGDISALAFDPSSQYLASGSLDTTARLWKLTDVGVPSIVLEGHLRNVNALAFSPNGHWLATASYDHTARLWDLNTINPAAKPIVLAGHDGILTSLGFSPDNRWLVTGSEDRTVRLWDLTSNNPAVNPVILRGHVEAINTLAISPEKAGWHWLATGSSDHTVRLWDLDAPDPAAAPRVLSGQDGAIFTLAFSSDGFWLATGAGDNSMRLWNMRSSNPAESPGILRGQTDEVNQVAFSQNGRWLAAASLDGSTLLWDLENTNLPENPLILRKSDAPINALSFSSSGHWLATAGGGNTIWLWDLNAAKNPLGNPGELRGNENPVTTLAISSTSSSAAVERWLASGSQDGSVRLWDLQSIDPNTPPRLLGIDPDHPVVALEFSPDSHWLAAASGFTLWLWDLTHPDAAPLALKDHENRITTLAFSPDGHWLATGSMDKTAQLWKLGSTGPSANPYILSGHEDWVIILAFSFDGHWLATGSKDHTARLWDLRGANPTVNAFVLRGHEADIRSLAFSQDGSVLATASDDHTARLWNLRAADPASDSVVLRGHEGMINSVAFSPMMTIGTGPSVRWLATGSSDHTVRLWRLQLEELKTLACQSAGRNLTFKEWTQYFSNQVYEKTCPEWPDSP